MKCCLCTDLHIADGEHVIQDAFTVVPTVQMFNVKGQMVGGIVALPVCYGCREGQLGKSSKQGLIAV